MATALDKGHKLASEGLSLFDSALGKLHASNDHLEAHAAQARTQIEVLTAEHNSAAEKIVANKGVIARLEALLRGEG
jgi:hypothetical protein